MFKAHTRAYHRIRSAWLIIPIKGRSSESADPALLLSLATLFPPSMSTFLSSSEPRASGPNASPQSLIWSRLEVEGGSPIWTGAWEESGRGQGTVGGARCRFLCFRKSRKEGKYLTSSIHYFPGTVLSMGKQWEKYVSYFI